MLNERQKEYGKLKISVLGDSISACEGWTPYGYAVYYKDDVAYENGISSVQDIWWKQVIDGLGGVLCVNNSCSGSFVSGLSPVSACSKERCSRLDGGEKPNIILVFMGSNDRGHGVWIGEGSPNDAQGFYGGYRIMLKRLKEYYPAAKIVCATLLAGYRKDEKEIPLTAEFASAVEQYNEAIRRAVQEEGGYLADVALSQVRYETLDYKHPTKRGQEQIANLWLSCIQSIILGIE